MEKEYLLLCAQPYGYGPVSKLLCLADGLQAENVPVVFIGTGIALELARRSSSLFHEIIDAPATSDFARTTVGDSIAVLSVMDREYSALAVEFGKPLYIVDSLYWMRSSVPRPFRHAEIHWVQDFEGVREQREESGDRVHVVGPILSRRLPPRRAGGDLVINLGGADSTFASVEQNAAYWRFVISGILNSPLIKKYRRRILVIAGEHCVRFLGAEFGDTGMRFASLCHEDAVEAFSTASLVLTSPGLTTSLECFRIGVPVCYLPPQNYSQWCSLRILRMHGLAEHAFHWEDMGEQYFLAERLDESERDPLIRKYIDCLSLDYRATTRFARGLAGISACIPQQFVGRQTDYYQSLGPDGTTQIIRGLVASLGSKQEPCA